MRGTDTKQAVMLCTISPDKRVPKDHPLRLVKAMAEKALVELSPVFNEMYSRTGRPSIPPERLLKASLLMAFFTIRSERLFCEQLDYNLMFRWFLDMNLMEESFDHSTFTKNRQRLLEHDVARQFFFAVVKQAKDGGLMSSEHFTVDGTLIEAWASLKSFRPTDEKKDKREPPDDPGNPSVDFHGEKRSNDTHQSTTDPESRLARKGKGKEAKLSYCQNVLMENRNGLIADIGIAPADGYAERAGALGMLLDLKSEDRRVTVGGDKHYDDAAFIDGCRALSVTPHVAQNEKNRSSCIDGRTTQHPGYALSQWVRKRIEEIFGWFKTVGNFRRTRYKGRHKTEMWSYYEGAAYNLLRMSKLMEAIT